jgi:hypothetical protein
VLLLLLLTWSRSRRLGFRKLLLLLLQLLLLATFAARKQIDIAG